MSLCGVGESEGGDEMVEIISQHFMQEKGTSYDLCADPIPAGELFLLTVWGFQDSGYVRKLCAWCEDSFKDENGLTLDYVDGEEFSEVMIFRIGNLSKDEVMEEFMEWQAKPEVYRTELNRRWSDVEETLYRSIRESEEARSDSDIQGGFDKNVQLSGEGVEVTGIQQMQLVLILAGAAVLFVAIVAWDYMSAWQEFLLALLGLALFNARREIVSSKDCMESGD